VIAIDGPAGAGKSTIARALANHFGYVNLETGAMYRSLALKALQTATPLDNEAALAALLGGTRIDLVPTAEGNRVMLDGHEVTERLRAGDVTAAASRVSVYPSVRTAMVERQRAMGSQGGVVMEGRDIGTVVFPRAEAKIFLVADQNTRASRRILQVNATGDAAREQQLTADLKERDARDSQRATAPLRAAEDAVTLDSTHLNLEEVVAEAIRIVEQKLAAE
jgi:cytidylate kinase